MNRIQTMTHQPILVSEFVAAGLLSIAPCELKAMARRGQAPSVALPNGVMRFRLGDLRVWAKRLQSKPARALEGQ